MTAGETPQSARLPSVEAAQTIGARLVTYVLGFGASVVVTRSLGPALRGDYFVLVTIAATVISLAQLSLTQAHYTLWADRSDRRALATGALLLAVVLGVPASLLAMAMAIGLGPDYIPVTDYALLAVAVAAVPAALGVRWTGDLATMAGRPSAPALAQLVAGAFQTAVLIGLGLAGRLTVAWVVVLWSATAALPLVPLVRIVQRAIGFGRASKPLVARAAALGVRYHAGTVAGFLMFRVDVFMLNALVSRRQVGLYSLAVTLGEALLLVTDAVSQAAIARQLDGQSTDAAEYTARVARTALVIGALLAGTGASLSPWAIPIVFGRPFADSVTPLIVLLPGLVLLASAQPLGVFCTRLNRPLRVTAGGVGALILNIGLNAVLIPRLGTVGASISSTLAYSALAAYYLAWFLRSGSMTIRDFRPLKSDLTGPLGALVTHFRLVRQGRRV